MTFRSFILDIVVIIGALLTIVISSAAVYAWTRRSRFSVSNALPQQVKHSTDSKEPPPPMEGVIETMVSIDNSEAPLKYLFSDDSVDDGYDLNIEPEENTIQVRKCARNPDGFSYNAWIRGPFSVDNFYPRPKVWSVVDPKIILSHSSIGDLVFYETEGVIKLHSSSVSLDIPGNRVLAAHECKNSDILLVSGERTLRVNRVSHGQLQETIIIPMNHMITKGVQILDSLEGVLIVICVQSKIKIVRLRGELESYEILETPVEKVSMWGSSVSLDSTLSLVSFDGCSLKRYCSEKSQWDTTSGISICSLSKVKSIVVVRDLVFVAEARRLLIISHNSSGKKVFDEAAFDSNIFKLHVSLINEEHWLFLEFVDRFEILIWDGSRNLNSLERHVFNVNTRDYSIHVSGVSLFLKTNESLKSLIFGETPAKIKWNINYTGCQNYKSIKYR